MPLRAPTPVFPFVALVGQEEMKRALLLNAVDPRIGGVMIMGHRGTGKSTAVRALAAVLPVMATVEGCLYNCDPQEPIGLCTRCVAATGTLPVMNRPVPVVDLPLGATEDRVVGSLDLEAALVRGEKAFEPGLLARAHRGFLYIDEANLLEDHLVDLLLDVAAAGESTVERESISIRHPARFVLVGSGNPEEGELRPQLLDRFGLYARIVTETDVDVRMEIVRRRLEFDADPAAFCARWQGATDELRARVTAASVAVADVVLDEELVRAIAAINADLGIDGHRGELTLARAARAAAALDGRERVSAADVRAVAELGLAHRLRRDPLETRDLAHRILDAVARHLS